MTTGNPISREEIEAAVDQAFRKILEDLGPCDDATFSARMDEIIEHGLPIEVRGIRMVIEIRAVTRQAGDRSLAYS